MLFPLGIALNQTGRLVVDSPFVGNGDNNLGESDNRWNVVYCKASNHVDTNGGDLILTSFTNESTASDATVGIRFNVNSGGPYKSGVIRLNKNGNFEVNKHFLAPYSVSSNIDIGDSGGRRFRTFYINDIDCRQVSDNPLSLISLNNPSGHANATVGMTFNLGTSPSDVSGTIELNSSGEFVIDKPIKDGLQLTNGTITANIGLSSTSMTIDTTLTPTTSGVDLGSADIPFNFSYSEDFICHNLIFGKNVSLVAVQANHVIVGPNDVQCQALGYGWNVHSNLSMKENITTIPDALDKVSQIRGVNFYWKPGFGDNKTGFTPSKQIGFIAEEVHQVCPSACSENEQGQPSGVDYSKITPLLVEAIKGLKQMVESQANLIAAQQAQVDSLQTQLNDLIG